MKKILIPAALAALAVLVTFVVSARATSPLPTPPSAAAPASSAPSSSAPAPAIPPGADPNCTASQRPSTLALPTGSYMDTIRKRGYLVVGTSQDTLLFSYKNSFTGAVEGFDVDQLREIARAIFGDPDKVQIKVIGYADRIKEINNHDVDIVADTMTINCKRQGLLTDPAANKAAGDAQGGFVDFSQVYYQAGQRLLVAKDSPAQSIADMPGKKVCAASGSTSLENIASKSKAVPVAAQSFADCLVLFQEGAVEGISTDDTILAGLAAQDPYAKVVGPAFTSEPYGMAISKDHPEFTAFVNAVLESERTSGTWTTLYKKWLSSFGTVPPQPTGTYK